MKRCNKQNVDTPLVGKFPLIGTPVSHAAEKLAICELFFIIIRRGENQTVIIIYLIAVKRGVPILEPDIIRVHLDALTSKFSVLTSMPAIKNKINTFTIGKYVEGTPAKIPVSINLKYPRYFFRAPGGFIRRGIMGTSYSRAAHQ